MSDKLEDRVWDVLDNLGEHLLHVSKQPMQPHAVQTHINDTFHIALEKGVIILQVQITRITE